MRDYKIIEAQWDKLPPALQYWILFKVILMTTPKHVIASILGIALVIVDYIAPGGILIASLDLTYIVWAAWILATRSTS